MPATQHYLGNDSVLGIIPNDPETANPSHNTEQRIFLKKSNLRDTNTVTAEIGADSFCEAIGCTWDRSLFTKLLMYSDLNPSPRSIRGINGVLVDPIGVGIIVAELTTTTGDKVILQAHEVYLMDPAQKPDGLPTIILGGDHLGQAGATCHGPDWINNKGRTQFHLTENLGVVDCNIQRGRLYYTSARIIAPDLEPTANNHARQNGITAVNASILTSSVNIPMDTKVRLEKAIPANILPPKMVTKYQQAIGTAIYLIQGVRFDIAYYTLSQLSRFMASPACDETHWNCLIHLLGRFVKGTLHFSITHQPPVDHRDNKLLTGFGDCSLGGVHTEGRSHTGIGTVITFPGAAIYWSPFLQRTTDALSTLEGEFIAS